MDKTYSIRGRVEVYFTGPDTFDNLSKMQQHAKSLETEENKISTMNVSFWRDEVKPKVEPDKKK
jgi:hypothetical protein